VRLALQARDRRVEFIARRLAGYVALQGGDPVGAMPDLRLSLQIAEENNDAYSLAVALNTLGIAAEVIGVFDEAIEFYARADEQARVADEPILSAMIATNLADRQRRMGDASAALGSLQRALSMVESERNNVLHATIIATLAETELELGRIERARTHIESLLSAVDTWLDPRFQSQVYMIASQVALRSGDLELAERRAQLAIEHAHAEPVRRSYAGLVLADTQIARKHWRAAIVSLDRVIADTEPFAEIHEEALHRKADALGSLNRTAEALAVMQEMRAFRKQVTRDVARRQMTFMRDRLESRSRERERLRLVEERAVAESRAARDRMIRNLVLLGVIAATLILLLLWQLRARKSEAATRAVLEQRIAERTQQLTEQMNKQRALEVVVLENRRHESIARLTGGIAHDFNNLMTIVLQASDLLMRNPAVGADPLVRNLAEECATAAETGGAISRQLIAFAGKQTLVPEFVTLGAFFARITPLLKRTLDCVPVEIDIEQPAPAVRVDPGQLTTALLNMLTNARDASPPGGFVRVEVRRLAGTSLADAKVTISVVDQGSGMSEATCARAIEPFFTTKEEGKGTGLGLSMVHGFALQSGGELRLRSALGVGTTVTLVIPAAQTQ
jgi:signal transduction histidine kinase